MVTMPDQWTLNKLNFSGRWRGRGAWFQRNQFGQLDLEVPTRLIDPTIYDITFQDADNGLWDGSGLFFTPGGEATYAISRDTYNASGSCWQFHGAGGQSSLAFNPETKRFGHEINHFSGRSRSMLVLIWESVDDQWRLEVIGAVAFRCGNAVEIEAERPRMGSPEALLEPLRGWMGTVETLRPAAGTEGQATEPRAVAFQPENLLCQPCSAVMPDGLVFSVPEQRPNCAFRLETGCLLEPDLFQQISILFDEQGRLTTWERRRFQPRSV